jgi:outer membrane protein OmpA-like peptidoglycan-associated protein
MANETNSPKRNSWIIWLIVLLILVLIGFYVFSKRNTEVTAEAASDSSTIESTINNHWTGVEPNLPNEEFDELKDTNLAVRGNDQLAIYSLDETIVFDVGDTTIKPAAAEKIANIMRSAEKRFPSGEIRIYGYADNTGDAATNKKIAEQRAQVVRNWIVKNTKIPVARISLNPIGEAEPIASNRTEAGRQKNRRVEIAVRKK